MKDEKQAKTDMSRRDFLGKASLGAVALSSAAAFAGSLRLIKPSVHYEESKVFKIGTPDNFPVGTVTVLEDKQVFIFSGSGGLHAVSKVCTHLGCLVSKTSTGFQCPCHGSKFNLEGKVVAGPAPRNLPWLEISQGLDGSLLVDSAKEIKPGTLFKV